MMNEIKLYFIHLVIKLPMNSSALVINNYNIGDAYITKIIIIYIYLMD